MRPSNHLISTAIQIIYTNYLVEAVAKRVCIYFELWRQRDSEKQEEHPNDENQEEYNTKQRMRM